MLYKKPYPKARLCAIRQRKTDGTPNKGGQWVETLGSVLEYVQNQKKWEVVFYDKGDQLPE